MSSLLWLSISGILYIEIAIVVLLLLPIISASWWKAIFQSSALRWIATNSTLYVRCAIGLLVLVFVEAIRETMKYSSMHKEAEKTVPHHEVNIEGINTRMFRAQRNLYISGFAMFTFFIMNRLVKLINEQARVEAQSAAAMAQARSASETARQLVEATAKSNKNNTAAKKEAQAKEIAELKATIDSAAKELEATRTRSIDVSKEYDQLREEHEKLKKQLANARR